MGSVREFRNPETKPGSQKIVVATFFTEGDNHLLDVLRAVFRADERHAVGLHHDEILHADHCCQPILGDHDVSIHSNSLAES